MLTQQPTSSIAVIKVNFMDPAKKADRIAECRSKAYNREYRDETIGMPIEITDGVNLTVKFGDTGVKDITSHLVGHDANIRFSKEQFASLNARFHSMKALGAYVEVEVEGNVTYGDLTVNGEEVQSITIYAKAVNAVEPMKIARVGSVCNEDEFFKKLNRDMNKKSNKAEEIRAQNRQARAAKASVEGPAARKTAKV